MHWVNRPTTQSLATFGEPVRSPTADTPDPAPPPGPDLAATGGGALQVLLAVLALGAVAGLRQRRRS